MPDYIVPLFQKFTIVYFYNNIVLLLDKCLRVSLTIVLTFKIFLISCDTIANIAPSLHKNLESSDLPVLEINLSFFKNELNYLTSNFLESLNYSEEIAS